MVYDTEQATAFFLNDVEVDFLDCLKEGKSLEECITKLKNDYSDERITEATEHIKNEGLLTDPHIPYQGFSQIYTLTLNVTQECNLR